MPVTILVVDDSSTERRMIVEALENAGMGLQIREAADGAEALPAALSGDVDVVISEIVMPNLDGLGLLRAIRAQRDCNALPFILVTSQNDPRVRDLSFEQGVSDYLIKPFSVAELIRRLQVQLRLRSLERELENVHEQRGRLSTHDELTGLANRRNFLEQCRRELTRTQRHGLMMSLLAMHAAQFRTVNDRLGYGAGDVVIAETARLLGRYMRGADTLARMGGTRFMALLPQTDTDQALGVAERLAGEFSTYPFAGIGAGVLTLLAGIATYPHPLLGSLEDVINAVESSLDRAQIAGRRIEVWKAL